MATSRTDTTRIIIFFVAVALVIAGQGCGDAADGGIGAESATGSGGYYAQDASGAADSGASHGGSSGDASSGASTSSSSGSSGASSGASSSGSGSSSGADAGASSSGGGADAGTTAPDAGDPNDPQTWTGKDGANPFASVDVGGNNKLVLEKMRVAVRVEGLRVRTLVDHIYTNPFPKVLEGTFRYSLPTESSVSYYAMFPGQSGGQPQFFGDGDQLNGKDSQTVAGTAPHKVAEGASTKDWGKLMEGRVQENIAAQAAYEAEVEKKVDPALVQQVSPNMFTAKVFPIPANGRMRILVAYEQTLPRVPNGYEYAFPLPKGAIKSLDFTLLAKGGAIESGKHVGKVKDVDEKKLGPIYIARKQAAVTSDGGTLVFQFGAKGGDEADVLAGTDPVVNKDHAIIRLRPDIKAFGKKQAATKQAIFLLDTSRSENAKRFGLNMELFEKILTKSPAGQTGGIEKFNVITFDAGARWSSQKWWTNDAAGRKAFIDSMKGVLLEGGTDFSAALRALAYPPMKVEGDVDVFVLSDGAITWGARDLDAILARFANEAKFKSRFFAYRLGLGAENLALYQKLTKAGAIFNCMSKTDLEACATAHLSPGMTLDKVFVVPAKKDGGSMTDVLVQGRLAKLFDNASLTIAGSVDKAGPANVVIEGHIGPNAIKHTIPVDLTPTGELAPRAWAEIATRQLFDTGKDKLHGLAMALSQHYRIAGAEASFVVLENENLYKTYKLKEWAAQYKGQAIAAVIAAAYAAGGKAFGTWARVAKLLSGHDKTVQLYATSKKWIDAVVKAAKDADLTLPDAQLPIPLVKKADTPKSYLGHLDSKDASQHNPHIQEAERRRKTGKLGAAVRALSTAAELNPGNSEIARMAGYRLTAWNQLPAAAEQLFGVLEARPLEPQSWRDLANVVREKKPALAAVFFEAALAGKWHPKFKQLKHVLKEEYALMVASLPTSSKNQALIDLVKARKSVHNLIAPTDGMRVTVTWNTNNTDIDLWVINPQGEKCYYQHKKLSTGGALLDDLTSGFGPERFAVKAPMAGNWKILLHYYANNGNKLIAETYAQVTIVTHAGKPNQAVMHHNVVLNKVQDVVDVANVTFK